MATQKQFVESGKRLTEEQLSEQVVKIRKVSEGRIPEEVREKFRSLDDCTTAVGHYVETAFFRKYGIKTHLFEVRSRQTPKNAPVVVNIHGGGWCLEHTERDIYFSRRMANRLHCLVIDVDYVLAPEFPYPMALEEIEALLNELPVYLKEWQGDAKRIVICGQSAGGNLSAAVMQRKNLAHPETILAQVICYFPTDNDPVLDDTVELDARGETVEYYNLFYNRNYEERKNSDVSLVNASGKDLSGLPPTDIVLAGRDNLMSGGKRYYELLKAHHVPTTCRTFSDSRHGFLVNLYDEWADGEQYVTKLISSYF